MVLYGILPEPLNAKSSSPMDGGWVNIISDFYLFIWTSFASYCIFQLALNYNIIE